MKSWTRANAIKLLVKLEGTLAPHYHVALAGGVLFRGKSLHDLDVVVFPHASNHLDLKEIREGLQSAGLRFVVDVKTVHEHWRKMNSVDTKHVEVWYLDDARVDIIVPSVTYEVDEFWRSIEKTAESVKDLPSWAKVGVVVDRPKPRRIIDQLREKFPGEWAYNALDNIWEYEGGWHVRAYAQLIGEDEYMTAYKRSDTGETVLGWLELEL